MDNVKADISKILGLDTPMFVEFQDLQRIADLKKAIPDVTVHYDDAFIKFHNANGEHVLTVGFNF